MFSWKNTIGNCQQTTFWLENCNLLDKNSGLESV